MHTLCGTVLRTSSIRIRNYADSDGETGKGGSIPLSHATPQQICTAQVITQPQKLHSQLMGLVTAVMYQVTGLMCSFVYGMGHQPAGIIHNNLAGDAHPLLFFHVQPANQSTITGVDLCHNWNTSFDTNHLYHFMTPDSTLNSTHLTNAVTKHIKIASFSLWKYSTLKFTYVI
jgi:hypothetical protein